MKNVLFSAAIALAFSTNAIAKSDPPEKCPGVAALQGVSLNQNMVSKNNEGKWSVVGPLDAEYDTTDHWTLFVTNVAAVDKESAYKAAANSLLSLSFMSGPEDLGVAMDGYGCFYTTKEGYYVVTMTLPAAKNFSARMNLK